MESMDRRMSEPISVELQGLCGPLTLEFEPLTHELALRLADADNEQGMPSGFHLRMREHLLRILVRDK